MKTSWVVITLLLTVTGLAKAVPPQNPEQVNTMIEELKSLHQQGVELHRDYDSEDPAQRKAWPPMTPWAACLAPATAATATPFPPPSNGSTGK